MVIMHSEIAQDQPVAHFLLVVQWTEIRRIVRCERIHQKQHWLVKLEKYVIEIILPRQF